MENDSFMDSYKQQVIDYVNSSGGSNAYNLGSHTIRGGTLIEGSPGSDTFEFGKTLAPNAVNDLISAAFDLTGQRMLAAMTAMGVYGMMKTGGDMLVEGYSGNDKITIKPMPKETLIKSRSSLQGDLNLINKTAARDDCASLPL